MQAIIYNEHLSSNLGDQVISDCTRYIFAKHLPTYNTQVFDWSGRAIEATSIAPHTDSKAHRLPIPLPDNLSNLLSWHLRRLPKVKQQWAENLRKSDVVVIGGGQLIMDNNLAFPLRLNTISRLVREHSAPLVLLSCGVGRQWTWIGRKMIEPAINRAAAISVRDLDSMSVLREMFPSVSGKLFVAPDPGLWAAETYNIRPESKTGMRIGLGITAPSVLRRRSIDAAEQYSLAYWAALADRLNTIGYDVTLFCNGAPKDYEASRAVHMRSPSTTLAKRPTSGKNLAQLINTFDLIVSHRLHANIVATSLDVKALGLGWDDKVRSYFNLINQPDAMFTAAPTISQMTRTIEELLGRSTVDRIHLENLKSQTLDFLLNSLSLHSPTKLQR